MSDVNFNGLAIRGLPTPIANNTRGPVRTDRYGNLVVVPAGKWRTIAADEGTYFIAHNATNDAATTLAGHAAPVLVDADASMTKPLIHLINNVTASAGTMAYLDMIEIEVITAGANGTADSWAMQMDTGTSRASGGTALTRVNPNMQSTRTPTLACLGGAITASAETLNVRDLGFGQFRPSIQVAGDKYMFCFAEDPAVVGSTSIATISHHVVWMPQVILGPSDQFLLALYSPSQSAAGVYKVRIGWTER